MEMSLSLKKFSDANFGEGFALQSEGLLETFRLELSMPKQQ